MHERTSRAIARLLFVLLCAAPTAATLASILVTWTPWYHHRAIAALERSLYRETGLVVEIDDFQRLSPSEIQLRGVRLVEPEMQREVARARVVWWVRQGDRMAIRLSQPEVQSAELTHAWRLVHDRFLCRPELTQVHTRLAANDLTIHSPTGSLTLRDVDAAIVPMARAIEARVECLPAGSRDDTAPLVIDIVRDRSGALPQTRWTMQSGETPLPCSVLAEYSPLFARLGQHAQFRGTLAWNRDREGWSIDLAGARFERVDLGRLFEAIPQRLTGTAEFRFERCMLKPGEIVDISGAVYAKRGYVSGSLLTTLKNHLGFRLDGRSDPSSDQPYDDLALRFDINGAQVRLKGICSTLRGYEHLRPGDAICVGGYALAGSAGDMLAAPKLLRAVAPAHSVLVPVSGQTGGLMQLLLPPKRPLPSEPNQTPVPRISTAGQYRGGELIRQR